MTIENLLKSMVCEMYAVEHSVLGFSFNHGMELFIDTDDKFHFRSVNGSCVDWNKHVCRKIKQLIQKLLPYCEIKVYGRYVKEFPKTTEEVLDLYGIEGLEAFQMASTIESIQRKTPSRAYVKESE